MQTPPDDHLYIGKLGKTFGLQGGLRFYGVGDMEKEVIYQLAHLFLPARGHMALKQVVTKGSTPVVFLAGVSDVSHAKLLVGQHVYALETALPDLDEGEYYFSHLLELPVTLNGAPFGMVTDLIEAGQQDLLVIEHDQKEHLVPMQAPYVTLTDGSIDIHDPPEGLFEL